MLSNEKYLNSLCASRRLIGSVTGVSAFSTDNRLLVFREETRDGQKILDDANDTKLKGLVYDIETPDCRLILNAKKKVPG